MSGKAEEKRKLIVEAARGIFAEKGYRSVTMKDIVEACNISRGGLYLYFSSTEEIFLEVMRTEHAKMDDIFACQERENASPADLLAFFLKEQKRGMLRKRNNLTMAVYEYYFENRLPGRSNPLKQQFETGVDIIESLIEAGIETGEFYCVDPRGTARNILYVLEGLRISAQTRGIAEETVDRELLYVMQGLIIEED
ncbi:MAG: TetR/AcrR family transcriptional regulator [Kineothrix sp.]